MVFTTALCLFMAAATTVAAPIYPVILRRGNLPEPVLVDVAKSYLDELTVAAESNSPAYERDYFKIWDTVSGTCNTREYVLKREGSDVVTNSTCTSTSGTWYSDYDSATWTAASDVDIDHLVPLVSDPSHGSRDRD
jgi:hypothetical protein